MLDDISQAVLAREEVVKYLHSGHGGETSARARERVNEYLEELRTTQRYGMYRALQHPLYPILRKIERIGENLAQVSAAEREHRIVYVSNHRSHIDYLVQPLVLDDNGIRPPLIAAGINLFGGPLGLIQRHVTGAIPIRRNTKDPAYLITLKAYVAEVLKKQDLFFYPEGGRSYSGELKTFKTGLIHAALTADGANLVIMPNAIAYDLVLEDHILARQGVKKLQRPFTRELAEMVRYAVGYRSRAIVTFGAPIAVDHRMAESRSDVLELTRLVRAKIGALVKVMPTAVFASAMRPSVTRARSREPDRPADRRARGAPRQSGRHQRTPGDRRGGRAAGDPRHHRRRGRPVPGPGTARAALLRPHHRAPARDPRPSRIDATHRCSRRFPKPSFIFSLKAARCSASPPGSGCASRPALRGGSSPARRSRTPSPPPAPSKRAACSSRSIISARTSPRLAEADAATREYLAMIAAIVESGIGRNISLKLTQIGLDVDRSRAVDNLRTILEHGAPAGFFLRLDMESSRYTDVTLDIFETLWHEGHRQLGVVLQAALRRSEQDLRRVLALGGRVRLVKGAYTEPRSIAYPRKADVDAAFARMMKVLILEGNYPAIATHDEAMLDLTRRWAAEHGIGPEQFEFQMLYGVRRDLQTVAGEGRLPRPRSTFPSAASGFPTSCAAWANVRRTSPSSSAVSSAKTGRSASARSYAGRTHRLVARPGLRAGSRAEAGHGLCGSEAAKRVAGH